MLVVVVVMVGKARDEIEIEIEREAINFYLPIIAFVVVWPTSKQPKSKPNLTNLINGLPICERLC